MRFKFDDFENLPSERGSKAKYERVIDGSGNVWVLKLYPGGTSHDENGEAPDDDGESNDEKSISLFLGLAEGELDVTIAFIFRDAAGSVYRNVTVDDINHLKAGGKMKGRRDTKLKRSEVLDKENNVLLDGALVVDVEIQIVKGKNDFQPSNPFAKNMLALLESEDDTDVSFKVGDTTIPAHKLILKTNAPILHSFCPKRGKAAVQIRNTTPEVFRIVLRYIYGGDASDVIDALNLEKKIVVSNLQRDQFGKGIIEAANRYGVVGLKLAVETALVERHILSFETFVDWILFADAKMCPLLKEYATNYFSSRVKDILNSKKSEKLKESPKLMSELMLAATADPNDCFVQQTSRMSVDELRKALDGKGLDVDGSKEMLVSRLDESNSNKRQRTE